METKSLNILRRQSRSLNIADCQPSPLNMAWTSGGRLVDASAGNHLPAARGASFEIAAGDVELAAGRGAIATGSGIRGPGAALAAVRDALVGLAVDGAGPVALGVPDPPGPVFAHLGRDEHCGRSLPPVIGVKGQWLFLAPGSPLGRDSHPSSLMRFPGGGALGGPLILPATGPGRGGCARRGRRG